MAKVLILYSALTNTFNYHFYHKNHIKKTNPFANSKTILILESFFEFKTGNYGHDHLSS